MRKIKKDPLNDLRRKPKDKANTVFLKLYAKRRGKYKDWNSLNAETYPKDIENKTIIN